MMMTIAAVIGMVTMIMMMMYNGFYFATCCFIGLLATNISDVQEAIPSRPFTKIFGLDFKASNRVKASRRYVTNVWNYVLRGI